METAEPAPLTIWFVSDANYFDDSIKLNGQRELLQSLASQGMQCHVFCQFSKADFENSDVENWAEKRGGNVIAEPKTESQATSNEPDAYHAEFNGVKVALLQRPDNNSLTDAKAESIAFIQLLQRALNLRRPDVLMVSAGPSMAAALSTGRNQGVITIALTDNCSLSEVSALRNADVVVATSRFAANYLREAYGLPSIHLPPIITPDLGQSDSDRDQIVFDGTTSKQSVNIVIQIAEELGRRRPKIPIVILKPPASEPSQEIRLPEGCEIKRPVTDGPSDTWLTARMYVEPNVGWEQTPFTGISALCHGVPVIVSSRGSGPELFQQGGLILSLSDRITSVTLSTLTHQELNPWVEAVLRVYDDPVFAATQRSAALLAAQRWAADRVVPEYIKLLQGLVGRLDRSIPSSNGHATSLGKSKPVASSVEKMREKFSWPEKQPEGARSVPVEGWLAAGSQTMLSRVLSNKTQLVVELGAWLGLSSRYIASHAPKATVVSVDHWQGSPEHHQDERYRELLPLLYETYLARCWEQRRQIIPLRMDSVSGLKTVAEFGLQPDVIYIDAEHSFTAVYTELCLAQKLFPQAVLAGDDFNWKGVRDAVDTFARRRGMYVDRFGGTGWRLLDPWAIADATPIPPGRGQSVVLVPHMNGIEWECEQGLRQLEAAGIRVVRRGGCSAIDSARNELVSNALHEEADAILFIDSDVGFDPQDALRLLARPEEVVCGIYAKKGNRELASRFDDSVKEALFGPEVAGPYPLQYAAAGFLRIRAGVLRKMIGELNLPLCNSKWGRGVWPFFQPKIVPHDGDKMHYLGEDWAFCYRLKEIGVTPLADTSIRLWHWGRYGFGWEDAGSNLSRYANYTLRLGT